jgi:hypothetical protein
VHVSAKELVGVGDEPGQAAEDLQGQVAENRCPGVQGYAGQAGWQPGGDTLADGGDRCAITLPSRALAGLLSGAVRESWRLKGPGPLREALRRKTIVGPAGCAPRTCATPTPSSPAW